jgi:hypothetical protein
METKKWKARKYHNFVWKTAKQDTEAYFYSDWRNWIGNIISGVGSAVIIPYILDIWKGREMTLPFFYQVILALFSGVFGFAVFVVGLYLCNGIWLVPANLYRKKEIQAKRPTFRDIEVKIHSFDPRESFKVGLEIINKKTRTIDDVNENLTVFAVEPRLERVDGDGAPGYVQGALPILFENYSYWNGGQFLPNIPSILLIAKSNENTVWIEYKKTFTFEEDIKRIEISKNTKYKLLIMVAGSLGMYEWQMEKCKITLDLFYSDEKGIEINNLIREPDYET